jgi:hypothetical protein
LLGSSLVKGGQDRKLYSDFSSPKGSSVNVCFIELNCRAPLIRLYNEEMKNLNTFTQRHKNMQLFCYPHLFLFFINIL